jgi:hypothetical protein
MKTQKVAIGDRVFQIEETKVEELISWLETNTKEVLEEDELIIDIEDTKGVEIVHDDSEKGADDEDSKPEKEQT